MTQVSAIVRDALLLLGVQDAAEPVGAQAMQDGIRALNTMLARWQADGITLGWADVSAPTDTLPAPAEAEEPITTNLALKLRASYKVALEPDVIQMATDGLAALRADVLANIFTRVSYDDLPASHACVGQAGFLAG